MFSLTRRRLYSTISQLEKQLLRGEIALNRSLIKKAITKEQFDDLKSILKRNSSLLSSEVKDDLIHHLQDDFSIYYLLKDHKWSTSQLIKLLASNPGRVDSSWDLFKRHSVEKSDELYVELITQLLKGESGGFDEAETLSALEWSRIMHLYEQLESKDAIQKDIINKLSEFDFSLISHFSFTDEVLLNKLAEDLRLRERLIVYEKLLDNGALLTHEQYANALEDCFRLDETPELPVNHEFFEFYHELSGTKITGKAPTASLTERLVQYIVEQKLDLDKAPESLLIRMKLMDIYGMKLNDLEAMLIKLHQYQSHALFGIEMVQLEVIQSYCYHSFIKEEPVLLKLVDALMPEEIPTTTIEALILANSAFGADKPLEIYNKYINHVSTKVNPASGKSPCAALTEAVILSSLYHNDRAFAELVFEKVVQSGKLEETEVPTLKTPFKVFGDAWVDDSWDSAKPKLKMYIANRLKYL